MIAIKISKIIGILHKLKYIFSERNFVNNIQLTNYASLELWPLIMGSKSLRHISSSEESHTISNA